MRKGLKAKNLLDNYFKPRKTICVAGHFILAFNFFTQHLNAFCSEQIYSQHLKETIRLMEIFSFKDLLQKKRLHFDDKNNLLG